MCGKIGKIKIYKSMIKKLFKKLGRKFMCFIGDHEWTSAVEQGIKPTAKQAKDGVDGFKDYAKLYCKHCPTESKYK